MSRFRGIQRHGNGWRFPVQVAGVRMRTRTCDTKEEALAERDRLRTALRDRGADARRKPKRSGFTLAEAQDALRAELVDRSRTEATIKAAEDQYRGICTVFDPAMPVRLLTRELVRTLIEKRRAAGIGNASISKHLGHLQRLVQIAIDEGEVDGANVVRSVRRPPVERAARKVVSLDVAIRAQNAAAKIGLHRAAAYFKLVRLTALRRSECARLRVDDVDIERCVLHVRKPKVRRLVRAIPMRAQLRHLVAFLSATNGGSDLLLPEGIRQFDNWVRRTRHALGGEWFAAHAIRHGAAEHVAETTGGDVTAVGKMLGHAPGSTAITMRYAQARDRRLLDLQAELERPRNRDQHRR